MHFIVVLKIALVTFDRYSKLSLNISGYGSIVPWKTKGSLPGSKDRDSLGEADLQLRPSRLEPEVEVAEEGLCTLDTVFAVVDPLVCKPQQLDRLGQVVVQKL